MEVILINAQVVVKDMEVGADLYEGNPTNNGDWKKLDLVENTNGSYSYTQHLVIYKIYIMKNITIKLFLLCLTICTMNCKSQIIVDMSSDVVLPANYNETGQYYEKDVHNYLDNFTGTWEYVNGNEKFQIILTKIIIPF